MTAVGPAMVPGASLLAQRPHPSASCSARATALGGERTPGLGFSGSLAAGDTVKLIVVWMPDTTDGMLQRVELNAALAPVQVRCASRRRVHVELHGSWRADSLALRVIGAGALDLSTPRNTLTIESPLSGRESKSRPQLTLCTLVAVEERTRFECRGSAGA